MKKYLLILILIICINTTYAVGPPWEDLLTVSSDWSASQVETWAAALIPVFSSIASQSNASARLLSAPPPTIKIERRAGKETLSVETLGPIVAEKATGLERGALSIALAFTDINFKTYNGQHLTTAFSNIIPGVVDHTTANFGQKVLSLNIFYGLSPKMTIGAIVPYIDASYDWNISVLGTPLTNATWPFHASKAGVGDIVLRVQYLLNKNPEKNYTIAGVGEVKLSTGDEDWLLGTGKTDYKLGFLYSKIIPIKSTFLGLDLNIAKTFSSGIKTKKIDLKEEIIDYKAGLNYAVNTKLTLVAEYIGRSYDKNEDTQDLVTGIKFCAPNKNKLVFSVLYLTPLNDNKGLRPDDIISAGATYQF